MIIICNLMGWAVVFYTIATIIFIKLDLAKDHVPGAGGLAPFFYGIFGLIFVLAPLGAVIGSLTINQIRRVKNQDIEITLSQAIFSTFGIIFCFSPIVQIGVIIVGIQLF